MRHWCFRMRTFATGHILYLSTMDFGDMLIRLSILVLIGPTQGVVGDLRQKPENAAGIVGSSIVLRCQGTSDSSMLVTWQHYSPDITNPIIIAVDGVIGESPNKDSYSISGDSNIKEYNLGINLQLVVAGRYRCFEQFGNPVPESLAHVTVLGTSPECFSTMQENITVNEVVTYTCEVTYDSSTINWAPVMSWAGPGNPNPVNQSTDGKVKFSIDVTGTPELNKANYSATTYFKNFTGTLPNHHASNVPGYSETHTFTPLVVLYPPRNIGIDNEKESYLPGDMITCSADGNPTVSYRWYNRTADSVYHTEANLIITAEMDGHDFGCEAFNEIRGVEQTLSKDIALVVSPATTTTSTTTSSTPTTSSHGPTADAPGPVKSGLSSGAIIGIAVGASLAALFIIAAVIYCCCCHDRKETPPTTPKNVPPVTMSKIHGDQVRMQADNGQALGPEAAYPQDPPPGYQTWDKSNPRGSYDQNLPPPDRQNPSAEGVVYADLALDDTPRSRKPIQVFENTDYAEIQRV